MGTRKNSLVEAVLTSTRNLCFEQKYKKNIRIFCLKIYIFGGKIFSAFEQAHFRNVHCCFQESFLFDCLYAHYI